MNSPNELQSVSSSCKFTNSKMEYFVPFRLIYNLGVLKPEDSIVLTKKNQLQFRAVIVDGGLLLDSLKVETFKQYFDIVKEQCSFDSISLEDFSASIDSNLVNFTELLSMCTQRMQALEGIKMGYAKMLAAIEFYHSALLNNDFFLTATQPNSYWVNSWLSELDPNACTNEGLCQVGFSPEIAIDFEFMFSTSINYKMEPGNYWILNYFAILVNRCTGGIPSTATTTLSEYTSTRSKRAHSRSIAMISTNNFDWSEDEKQSIILQHLNPEASINDYYVFCHGSSALNIHQILNNGIILNYGQGSLDFSHRNGFYVYEKSIKFAFRWAKDRHTLSDIGVIIYFVEKRLFDQLNILDFDQSSGLKWQQIVTAYRSADLIDHDDDNNEETTMNEGESDTNTDSSNDSIDGATATYMDYDDMNNDVIRGLACVNPTEVMLTQDIPIPVTPSVIQVALRSERALQLFHNSLVGVVFCHHSVAVPTMEEILEATHGTNVTH